MWRRILETWRETGAFGRFLLVGGVPLAVIFCFVVVWVLRNWHGEVVAPPPAPARPADRAAESRLETVLGDLPALPKLGRRERDIIENHFAAIGGVRLLSSIRSLLSTGEITTEDGSVHGVVIAKKDGTRMRVSVRTPKGQLVMVVSPGDDWRALWQEGRLVQVTDLDDEDRQRFRRSSYIVSELFMAMQNSWTISYLGDQAFNYRMAHCFEVKLNSREVIRFFIDPDTYLDLGREEWVFDAEGNLTITRMVGTDHLNIGGLLVPGRIETYENNVLKQTFAVTDVEVNPGILASTFRRPSQPD
jgi:outer membrane lipoprotein-sorting protein